MAKAWINGIEIRGSFTNPQYVGYAPDLTGLSIWALLDGGSERDITSSTSDYSVSPSTWASIGNQTLTITYTGSTWAYTNTPTDSITANVVEYSESPSPSLSGIPYQKDRLELAKYNFQVVLDYHENVPESTDHFSDYYDYLEGIRFCEIPVEVDYAYGYIDGEGWHYENNGGLAKNPIDIYKIKKDHNYFVFKGADATSGSRFRVCTVNEDIRLKTSGTSLMQAIISKNESTKAYETIGYAYNNPDYNGTKTPFFRASDDGWLLIQKDNNYTTGLSCYVFDLTTPVPQIVDPELDESLFDIDSNGKIALKSSVDKNTIFGDRIIPDTVGGVTVTGLGDNCFDGCFALNSLEFPSTVTSFGDYSLANTGLRGFTFPSTVTAVGDYAFYNCGGITSITVPSTVQTFGDYVFAHCRKLTTATIQPQFTKLYGTFSECSRLTNVTIPNTVTNNGYLFNSCEKLNYMPSMPNATQLMERVFYDTGLVNAVIPNNFTYLAWHSFRYCDNLLTIVIPSSVTTISITAITRDRSLNWIEFQGATPPTIIADSSSVALFSDTNDCPIYVPDAAVNDYKTATGWTDVASRIVGVSNRPA